MATRTRGGGGTGMAVALVIFVLLFVFSLGAAIVVFTKVEDAERSAADAKTSLETYVIENQTKTPEVQEVRERALKAKSTVVGQLVDDNEKLRRAISSDLTSTQALEGLLKAHKIEYPGQDLISVLNSLRADMATLTTDKATEKAAREMLEAKVLALEQEKKQLEDLYRTADAARTAKIAELGQASEAAKTEATTVFTSIKEAQAKAAEEALVELEKFEQQLTTKDQEIAELRRVIQQLRALINPGGDKSERDASKEPDGTILSTIPSDNLVTIDLGQNDHILLGLTFEVYDKKTGVSRDQFGDFRGKATVEVVKVKPDSSECRIVRTERGKPIFDGDLVANLVYDKYRTYRFYVYGNFDIDNDGRPSSTDTRRIKSMIEQWGGIVSNEFGYDVDFLVLGSKPEVPRAPEGGQDIRTPEQIAAEAAIQAELLKHTQLEGDARLLRIPVLNQNRFLSLIGFYER